LIAVPTPPIFCFRAVARKQKLRAALAPRTRIIRQLLTESVLLALCGGLLGILISMLSVKWIHALGTKSIPRLQDIVIDGRFCFLHRCCPCFPEFFLVSHLPCAPRGSI